MTYVIWRFMWVSWFVSEHDWFPLSESSVLKSSLIEVVYFNLGIVFHLKKQTRYIVSYQTSDSETFSSLVLIICWVC